MNLNELAKEAHQIAVEHGWWSPEPSFGDLVALMHSELSEALEEYRAGRPMLWYSCDVSDACYEPGHYHYNVHCCRGCGHRGYKPEGIAVELADCIIRILDFFGNSCVDIDGIIERKKNAKIEVPENFGDMIARLHMDLSMAYDTEYRKTVSVMKLIFCIMRIHKWATKNNVDMEPIIRKKMAYNRTRPYRHGGKLL